MWAMGQRRRWRRCPDLLSPHARQLGIHRYLEPRALDQSLTPPPPALGLIPIAPCPPGPMGMKTQLPPKKSGVAPAWESEFRPRETSLSEAGVTPARGQHPVLPLLGKVSFVGAKLTFRSGGNTSQGQHPVLPVLGKVMFRRREIHFPKRG